MCLQIIFNVYVYKSYLIYMYKQDLALNDLQWLICHKTQPNQTNFHSFVGFQVFLSNTNNYLY